MLLLDGRQKSEDGGWGERTRHIFNLGHSSHVLCLFYELYLPTMNSWLIKHKALVFPFLALYAFLVILTSWTSDDAIITFRSLENFLHGYGPVFNIGERVQTFTHPLWFLIQAAANFIFNLWKSNPLGQGQMYFLNIFISVAISLLMASIFAFKVATSTKGAVLGLLIFSVSKAFLDFSTSA